MKEWQPLRACWTLPRNLHYLMISNTNFGPIIHVILLFCLSIACPSSLYPGFGNQYKLVFAIFITGYLMSSLGG